MKGFSQNAKYLLLSWLVISISCRKEYSCDQCHANKPPIANAGQDIKIVLPLDSLTLDGKSSSDPDGKIIAWEWTMIGGASAVAINFSITEQASVRNLVAGEYQFELKVSDDGGLFSRDTVQVTVESITGEANHRPIAHAGADQKRILRSTRIPLDGSASHDPDGIIMGSTWSQLKGPNIATITHLNLPVSSIVGFVEGIYIFRLEVIDDKGVMDDDTVQIEFVQNTLSGNIVLYQDVWGCNDLCQDGDVYWTPQSDPANPLRYFDPDIPLEVSILLDGSTDWVSVSHRDSLPPRINQFFYYIERNLLWVFAHDAKLIGKAIQVRVKFL
jgi:hypothetical protein